MAGIAHDDGRLGFREWPRGVYANVRFPLGQENRDRRLLPYIDDAGELPFGGVECKRRQLIPPVTGDGATKAEVSGRCYFEFHW